MKNILRATACYGTLALLVAIAGCDRNFAELNPKMRGDFKFDVTGDISSMAGIPKRAAKNSAASQPFCNLSKFEITVLYVMVGLDDDGSSNMSEYELLNVANSQGIKVDLVSEKLSDKVDLILEDPKGNVVRKICIGFDDAVIINGYIDSLGTALRSTPAGFVSDSGISEDYVMKMSEGMNTVFNGDNFEKPLKGSPVYGTELKIPDQNENLEPIQFTSTSTLEFKWPMDNVISFYGEPDSPDPRLRQNKWRITGYYWACPYFEGQTILENYYLKSVGRPYFTDIMKILSDTKGYPFPGQVIMGAFNTLDVQNMKGSGVRLSAGIDGAASTYNQSFHKNSDNSIWLKLSDADRFTIIPAFKRENHTGIMVTSQGDTVHYECVKAN